MAPYAGHRFVRRAQTDIQTLKQSLRQSLGSDDLPDCHIEPLEERDWVRVWLDDFHSLCFGKRLWVCPTEQRLPQPEAVNVVLDPGLAFGTGTHPTTALCLEWLAGTDLSAKTVIDYGCGSGILAIAAAKLGARQVWAIDIDPQALLATDRNAVRNSVRERISLAMPEELPLLSVDILLANILAGPLIELAPYLSSLVRNRGRLVLAGLLEQQAAAVQAAYTDWFDFGPSQQREEWILLQAIRKAVVLHKQ